MNQITEQNFDAVFAGVLVALNSYQARQATAEQKLQVSYCIRDMLNNEHYYRNRAIKGEHLHVCKTCGALEAATYTGTTPERLTASELCFGCDLWEQRAKEANSRYIIIEGCLYTDAGPSNSPAHCLGHGGQIFTIEKDGRVWKTNNLWCGGTIPEEVRDRLPDNAAFVKSQVVR